MRIALAGAILALLLLQPASHAEEQEPIRIVSGELSAYGPRTVVVGGERIVLCEGCEVLDTLDKPITVEGLVATDIVTVTIKKSCAIQVKAEKIRR